MVRLIRSITKGKRNIKRKHCKSKRTKSHAKRPIPRVTHLALPPELGSENCRATPWRRSRSRPSCPYWTWEDAILA